MCRVVKNSKKKVKPQIFKDPDLPTQNRFAILQQDEMYPIGDVTIRNQSDHFDSWKKMRLKFRCYPGAKIKKITEKITNIDLKNDFLIIANGGWGNV